MFTGPGEVRKRIGIKTYLIKLKGPGKKYKVYNLINLYPYQSKETEECKFLGNIKKIKEFHNSREDETMHQGEGAYEIRIGIIEGVTDEENINQGELYNEDGEKGGINQKEETLSDQLEEEWISRKEKWKEKKRRNKKTIKWNM